MQSERPICIGHQERTKHVDRQDNVRGEVPQEIAIKGGQQVEADQRADLSDAVDREGYDPHTVAAVAECVHVTAR